MSENEISAKYELEAQKAIEALRPQVAALTPEALKGFKMLVQWIRVWKGTATYKHLMINLLKEF